MTPKPGTPINTSMGPLEWSLLLLLSLIFGGTFLFNDFAVRTLPTVTIVFCRMFFGGVILFAALVVFGRKIPTSWRVWRAFLVMGFLESAAPFSLIVWSQQHIESGVAAIGVAAMPVFAVIAAHIGTSDEKITPLRLVGVVFGLAGVAVLVGGAALESSGVVFFAQLACVVAGASYGLAAVFGRRFREMGVSSSASAVCQAFASALLLLPLMLFLERPWELTGVSTESVLGVLALAVLSCAVAYTLYFRILGSAGATNLSLVTVLIPVNAVILGVLFLDETLLPRHLLGLVIIILGLAAIDGRLVRALRRSAFGTP